MERYFNILLRMKLDETLQKKLKDIYYNLLYKHNSKVSLGLINQGIYNKPKFIYNRKEYIYRQEL